SGHLERIAVDCPRVAADRLRESRRRREGEQDSEEREQPHDAGKCGRRGCDTVTMPGAVPHPERTQHRSTYPKSGPNVSSRSHGRAALILTVDAHILCT